MSDAKCQLCCEDDATVVCDSCGANICMGCSVRVAGATRICSRCHEVNEMVRDSEGPFEEFDYDEVDKT